MFVLLPRKTKADKKYYINLNIFRNTHYIVNNQAKQIYDEIVGEQLKGIKFKKTIEITYRLFKSSNRRIDRANILSITDKFFCDCLVNNKCIEDDNDEYIQAQHYYSGGLDRENPRVEITIETVDC